LQPVLCLFCLIGQDTYTGVSSNIIIVSYLYSYPSCISEDFLHSQKSWALFTPGIKRLFFVAGGQC